VNPPAVPKSGSGPDPVEFHHDPVDAMAVLEAQFLARKLDDVQAKPAVAVRKGFCALARRLR
jgi:hypothetical protein